ncbi:MRG-domain-containing protein [Pluteus cervinus]|uniref:MRG-domain-containing protein n=1 Tax=Pluteus cervinus TaxID=181527 RepID=A0ACD3B0U4_9AGAR|nr:MRG-domain-containing protein [Pluteus cervinus]
MAASTAAAASSTPTYTQNERVLCYHGPLIYEAKVLMVQTFDEATTITGHIGPHYFVHYKGWKQTWDEWVPASRLLKHNENNLAMQKTLQQTNAPAASTASASKSAKAGTTREGAGTRGARKDGTRGTKRGREEDETVKKPDIRLTIPELLKVQLVDDWECVTKNNQLVTLPRNPTVVDLLTEFAAYITSAKPSHLREPALVVPTIVSGLQVYFDRSLGANLLYRFERPQYAEMRKQYVTGPKVIIGQEKEVSAVYGAEHLLRMLVSLPQMIAHTTLDPESVLLVRDYVNELLLWMGKERDRIFQTEYESASLQYQNISRS